MGMTVPQIDMTCHAFLVVVIPNTKVDTDRTLKYDMHTLCIALVFVGTT